MERKSVPARRILVKIDRDHIAEAHSIVEACDGVAVLRTLDPDTAIVEMIATPDTVGDAMKLAELMERLYGAVVISGAV